jgi:hypothetical protein
MNNGCMERNRCLNYKIIIPQEETKQDYSGVHFKHCYQGEYEDGCKYGEDDCPAKPRPFVNTMPMFYIVKQETLEEAAKRYARKQCDDMYDNKGLTGASWGWETSLDFIAGAKWQAQKMYSGEEVRKILLDITLINPTHLTLLESGYGQFPDSYKLTEKGINYIIEQFKKK